MGRSGIVQGEGDCSTIREFCQRHRLPPAMYFKLQKEGRGPRVMHLGRHVVISREAAAQWRKRMEHESGK